MYVCTPAVNIAGGWDLSNRVQCEFLPKKTKVHINFNRSCHTGSEAFERKVAYPVTVLIPNFDFCCYMLTYIYIYIYSLMMSLC